MMAATIPAKKHNGRPCLDARSAKQNRPGLASKGGKNSSISSMLRSSSAKPDRSSLLVDLQTQGNGHHPTCSAHAQSTFQ